MRYKVRISHFDKAGLEPWNYPEEVVTMTDAEFDYVIEENQCYYDEETDTHYAADRSTGYEILAIL